MSDQSILGMVAGVVSARMKEVVGELREELAAGHAEARAELQAELAELRDGLAPPVAADEAETQTAPVRARVEP